MSILFRRSCVTGQMLHRVLKPRIVFMPVRNFTTGVKVSYPTNRTIHRYVYETQHPNIHTLKAEIEKHGFDDYFEQNHLSLLADSINTNDIQTFKYIINYIASRDQTTYLGVHVANFTTVINHLFRSQNVEMFKHARTTLIQRISISSTGDYANVNIFDHSIFMSHLYNFANYTSCNNYALYYFFTNDIKDKTALFELYSRHTEMLNELINPSGLLSTPHVANTSVKTELLSTRYTFGTVLSETLRQTLVLLSVEYEKWDLFLNKNTVNFFSEYARLYILRRLLENKNLEAFTYHIKTFNKDNYRLYYAHISKHPIDTEYWKVLLDHSNDSNQKQELFNNIIKITDDKVLLQLLPDYIKKYKNDTDLLDKLHLHLCIKKKTHLVYLITV